MKLYLEALYRNLVAGVRLALFMPVRAADFRASPLDYAFLVAFNFAVWIAAAALRTGMAGDFDSAALAIYFAGVPLVLATALAIARIYGAPGILVLVAVGLTASDALFELVALALPSLVAWTGYARTAVLLLLAWLWIVSLRAVIVCAGRERPQVLKGAAVVTAMIVIGFFALPRTRRGRGAGAARRGAPVPPAGRAHRACARRHRARPPRRARALLRRLRAGCEPGCFPA